MPIANNQLERLNNLPPARRAEFFRLLREERMGAVSAISQSCSRSLRPEPLSFAQRRLIFLDQMYPEMPTYNVPVAVRLRGPLNTLLLERSLNDVLQRHDVLRTSFRVFGGTPMQVVVPDFSLPLSVEDLTGLPIGEHEAKARELALEEGRRPFNLQAGPPIRARLLRLDDDDHIALITLHHVICDGESLEILIHDLGAFYEAAVSGSIAELPELTVQYADFVHKQTEWLESSNLTAQIAYWKKQLQHGEPELEIPSDFPRPASPALQAKRMYFEVEAGVQQSLEKLAISSGTTLMMVLLAAFQVLLKIWSGRDSVSIGSPIDNRKRTEFGPLIGFFVNTVVYRTDLAGEITFADALQRARETVLLAHANQDVPFEMLLKELHGGNDSIRAPLFRVWFVFLVAPPQRRMLSGIELTPFPVEYEISRYDLKLNMFADAGGLHGSFEHDTRLFAASTQETLRQQYRMILHRVASEPDIRLQQLAEWLHEAAEKQRTEKQKQLLESNLQKLLKRQRQPSSGK